MSNLGIDIRVNGETKHVPTGTSLAQLVESLGLGKQACAVELNLDIVRHELLDQVRLQAEDQVEIVTLVGGG